MVAESPLGDRHGIPRGTVYHGTRTLPCLPPAIIIGAPPIGTMPGAIIGLGAMPGAIIPGAIIG